MGRKHWKIAEQDADTVEKLTRELSVSPIIARLLINRGLSDAAEAEKFLRKENGRLYDPFLLKDMERAVVRLSHAIETGEFIAIYGDYDVDGVTSVSILYQYLKKRGAKITYYIPNRIGEGYGLNAEAAAKLREQGVNLILTVDTGVTAIEETERIKELGMDIIITDHHECRAELPDACAVVNPRRSDDTYPFKNLAGVGVAFKVICAMETAGLESTAEKQEAVRAVCLAYADLTAVGTIADVMPLTDENRLLVNMGLALIQKTNNPGITALLEEANLWERGRKRRRITSSSVSFGMAPRINAAGRISRASRAVELFLTDSQPHADRIAAELCEINRERQSEENKILDRVYERINTEMMPDNPKILVLEDDTWHHGVIGIVASRITEHYHLPSILISFEGCEDGVGKGSGRSIKGLNLVEALASCGDLLEKYGGHELAAGLSVRRENVEEFRRRIQAYCGEHLTDTALTPEMSVDCELTAEDITLETANDLYCLEPYGTSNPVPLFCIRNMPLLDVTGVSGGKHTKILAGNRNAPVTAMYFGHPLADMELDAGERADIVFQLDINEFQGRRQVQMLVRDMDFTEDTYAELEEGEKAYCDICEGRIGEGDLPERADFKAVYLYLNRVKPCKLGYHKAAMVRRLGRSYQVIRIALEVLLETGLLNTLEFGETYIIAALRNSRQEGKVDLEQTPTMQRLRKLLSESVRLA